MDLIDRQVAVDAIQQHREDVLGGYEYDEGVAFVYAAAHNHIIDVIKHLPSAQPEQTDCDYCHEDRDGYVRPIEKNSHAWIVRRGRSMKLRVGFKGGYSECDILFCPMCGRRLADGRCNIKTGGD